MSESKPPFEGDDPPENEVEVAEDAYMDPSQADQDPTVDDAENDDG